MAGKLFGTDGVRGVAGEFLTAELALGARPRRRARSRRRTRPQVLIVRDTRESGEMLEAALAAGVAAGGGHALLGGVLPTPGRVRCSCAATASTWRPWSRPRTTRTRTTASSSSAPRARSSTTPRRPRSSGAARASPSARIGRLRELHGAAGGLPARARGCASPTSTSSGVARPARLRERRHLPRGARDLPPPRRRRGRDRGRARRPQHQRRRAAPRTSSARRAHARAATTSASPSTATATACSRSTATATVVDGDELIALAALHLREQRPAAGRRRGRDGDDQLRLPPGDGATPGSRWPPRRRRPPRARRAARGAAGRSAASSRATSSTPASCPSGDGIAAALLDARGARRRATSPSATRWRSCRSGS